MPRPRIAKRNQLRRNALNVRFNDSEYDLIAHAADRHGTSLSDLVRTIVIQHLTNTQDDHNEN